MIKRVAQALSEADTATTTYEELARAAIKAMREPSKEMMRAMFEAMFEQKFDGTPAPMIGAGFEAAIDAALQEQTR